MTGTCKHGKEPSGSIIDKEFEYLNISFYRRALGMELVYMKTDKNGRIV
jgi:hypothetical protein